MHGVLPPDVDVVQPLSICMVLQCGASAECECDYAGSLPPPLPQASSLFPNHVPATRVTPDRLTRTRTFLSDIVTDRHHPYHYVYVGLASASKRLHGRATSSIPSCSHTNSPSGGTGDDDRFRNTVRAFARCVLCLPSIITPTALLRTATRVAPPYPIPIIQITMSA